MAKKIDPAVLWFRRTDGCCHHVLGSVYNDLKLWNKSHQYWCCDNCLVEKGMDLRQKTFEGFRLVLSISNPAAKISIENQIFVPCRGIVKKYGMWSSHQKDWSVFSNASL